MSNDSRALENRKDELEKYEFMMGPSRGKLAVAMDMVTDAMILAGQHGVYCISARNPSKPAMDLQAIAGELQGAKELLQQVMEELRARSG